MYQSVKGSADKVSWILSEVYFDDQIESRIFCVVVDNGNDLQLIFHTGADFGKNVENTRKVEVSESTEHPDVVTKKRGETEEDREKNTSKTKSLFAWEKIGPTQN